MRLLTISSKTGRREPTDTNAWLVIAYLYLWTSEHSAGADEGRKTRPSAIVAAARQVIDGREIVTVVPITHTAPKDSADAIEIPALLKAHLGLDDLPSWIVITETSDFLWPGPDIRPSRDVAGISRTAYCRPGSSRIYATASFGRTVSESSIGLHGPSSSTAQTGS